MKKNLSSFFAPMRSVLLHLFTIKWKKILKLLLNFEKRNLMRLFILFAISDNFLNGLCALNLDAKNMKREERKERTWLHFILESIWTIILAVFFSITLSKYKNSGKIDITLEIWHISTSANWLVLTVEMCYCYKLAPTMSLILNKNK